MEPSPYHSGPYHLNLGRNSRETLEQAVSREWLVTNGIGGFASGAVGEVNTRRYHGLLLAALAPPLGRTLLVSGVDVTAHYYGRSYRLFTHEFSDGTVDPHGYLQIESFYLDQGLPVWRYALGDALLEKRIVMTPGKNTTHVHFRVLRASAGIDLELMPLCAYRDYHSHGHGGADMDVRDIPGGFEVVAFPCTRPYRLTCTGARTDPNSTRKLDWYWHFKHRAETARGLDDDEDLFRPGRFMLRLASGENATLAMTAEAEDAQDFGDVYARLLARQQKLLSKLPEHAPGWIKQLALAADQFIVERYQNNKPAGKTIIAGYPWFGDWGRDTMIALPGLTLATGRFDVAASILRTFAAHVSKGMLPNRFPDGGETPEYNTADATLWYFHAIDQYTRRSGDTALAAALYPALRDIIDWHKRGTRYGIKADPGDCLLTAGEEGVQLTWMDAKVGDWVVTPRIGKAVEINALWYNALCVMAALAAQLGEGAEAAEFEYGARRVKAGFQRFWNKKRACLYDVIDGPEGEPDAEGRRYDARLRPNQLFAVSLPYSPLDANQQKAVVELCARELLTSFGLRSLARGEPGYAPHYQGDPQSRDGAYHQGTVWAWLIGSFVDAHYRVYGDKAIAETFLQPLALHMSAACIGSVSEIFDAEPPFAARGCFAQAWSVAELLRAWVDLNASEST